MKEKLLILLDFVVGLFFTQTVHEFSRIHEWEGFNSSIRGLFADGFRAKPQIPLEPEKLKYQKLTRAKISKFSQIDRTETIDNIYYEHDGILVLEEEHCEVSGWDFEEKQERILELQDKFDKGATFFGTFDGNDLTGMSVLDHNPVGSGNNRLNLEGLWVSHNYRGKGIGKALFQLAVQEARKRGAKALYISATPSENTVRFYRNLGCRPAEPIDQYLYEKEPEDIHLELILIG